MDINSFLAPGDALVDVRASDKTRLLTELWHRAAASLRLGADTVAGDILKREELGSTGVGGGVAIPHARIAGLQAPFGILARLRGAIDFDAIDGQPVDIVFLLLLPAAPAGEQLNALASVARKLRDPKIVHDLRRAGDSTSLYHAIIPATQ
jgi:PTS system nitrogen regulatory IIA component